MLSHCGMGFNRSAFVAGLIMIEMGMTGPEVVARLRERRPGALFNDGFAELPRRPSATQKPARHLSSRARDELAVLALPLLSSSAWVQSFSSS